MTTRLVMIPASWQMSREAAFLAQSTGELSQIRSRNAQEQTEALDDLNGLLDEGYTVISQTLISGGQRDLITLILYKPAEKPIKIVEGPLVDVNSFEFDDPPLVDNSLPY